MATTTMSTNRAQARVEARQEQGHWYLLQCRARQEARALENLARQHFDAWCPRLPVQKRRRGRIEREDEALFPGYLFVRLWRESNWQALQSTRGVSRLVRFNGEPATVDSDVVDHIRSRCAAVNEPRPLFRAGQRVRICEGAFRDIEAMVQAVDGVERVVLLLNFMQREQRVAVTARQLVAV